MEEHGIKENANGFVYLEVIASSMIVLLTILTLGTSLVVGTNLITTSEAIIDVAYLSESIDYKVKEQIKEKGLPNDPVTNLMDYLEGQTLERKGLEDYLKISEYDYDVAILTTAQEQGISNLIDVDASDIKLLTTRDKEQYFLRELLKEDKISLEITRISEKGMEHAHTLAVGQTIEVDGIQLKIEKETGDEEMGSSQYVISALNPSYNENGLTEDILKEVEALVNRHDRYAVVVTPESLGERYNQIEEVIIHNKSTFPVVVEVTKGQKNYTVSRDELEMFIEAVDGTQVTKRVEKGSITLAYNEAMPYTNKVMVLVATKKGEVTCQSVLISHLSFI